MIEPAPDVVPMPDVALSAMESKTSARLLLASGMALVFAVLVGYAETRAFAWDEGFHLLAAQLIARGRRPYLDFFFPQTPLNAYWNALLLRLFGESWRVTHAAAAVLTAGAVLLGADYVAKRFPAAGWRLPAALTVIFLFGLNLEVVEYGPSAQAYGMCLFLIVAAFRCAVAAVRRETPLLAAAAGLCAGAAASASLLSSSVTPILLLWIAVYSRPGKRWAKASAYLAGVFAAFLPMLVLYSQGPTQVLFNVFRYHLLYRLADWPNATQHDLETLTSWMISPQALVIGILAAAGLATAWRKQPPEGAWTQTLRSEFMLCAWLAAGLTLHVSTAHPTFIRYYMLAIPFLGILATLGLFEVSSRLCPAAIRDSNRMYWPAMAVGALFFLSLARGLWDDSSEVISWPEMEHVAAKVSEVTAPGRPLMADENVYFLTRHSPPAGLEHSDAHKLTLAPALETLLHIIPRAEVEARVAAGAFDTVETCDDDVPEKLGLAKLYKQSAKVDDCQVFWDKAPAMNAIPPAR